MLEEKLRQASETTVRQRKRTGLILVAALLLCTVFIIAVSFLHVKTSHPGSGEASSIRQLHPEDTQGLRQQFIRQMQVYEEEIEPEIAAANLKNWNPEKDAGIRALKENAIAAFTRGNYSSALNKLSSLNKAAKQALADRDAVFALEMDAARQALNKDQYMAGKIHITKALLLKQNDGKALELEKQIEALPTLMALLKKAGVAHTENNPEKEYGLMAEAVKIAPQRADLKKRRDALAETIREARFTAMISRGLLDVQQKNILRARLDYAKAKALYPGRPELRALNASMTRASRAFDLEHALAQANQAIARDDWTRAQSVYADASKRHPDDTAILDGLRLASRIVSLQHSITDYIRRSERLSSRNIFANARNTLEQAGAYARHSKSLIRKMADLKKLLAKMDVKVPVFVKSDNQTYILVRGVGKVGETLGRTIHLRPGDYTFEGIRSGYKSKLVQVRVPVGRASFQVEVVCDERI